MPAKIITYGSTAREAMLEDIAVLTGGQVVSEDMVGPHCVFNDIPASALLYPFGCQMGIPL
ncbi:hypothetical protein DO021_15355 [Desulfobacter hydrogenophilus]|uniref:Uncharacterized protein n=1 Tax=Desulfobacter hydrogenophilus TaxID=2291 RepID=A0A328FCP2_9BACT|nr:hypothetical protein [Desulfobacter hydrogenophilus]NDY72874.1 hypothetical protein [Desulfobacter hydrogenophilus]QBH13593.1 hypothetical protein EYB58_12050 [Desulfobacter hydrogenophilus]RAM01182.1 hypothetical protein DO021_15355 [Desulfobacter hydrogenophilus]